MDLVDAVLGIQRRHLENIGEAHKDCQGADIKIHG
jgi:hypothetical protein